MISPDIGGGFGNKVGVYPGYVMIVVGSIVLGVPVKWVEDRIENLSTTAFARDYHMTGELAATKDGKITGLRAHVLANHGAFDACADPTKYPAGLFSICTGSYDIPVAFVEVDGVYTNRAPGGVAYRCSFRVTEAAYMIERLIDILAQKLDMDPSRLRWKNFIQPAQFPYKSALGWEYDSRRLPLGLEKGHGSRWLPKPARRAGTSAWRTSGRQDPQSDGHRRLVLHRNRWRGTFEELRHLRRRHVRFLRDPRSSHGRCHRKARDQEPGAGS